MRRLLALCCLAGLSMGANAFAKDGSKGVEGRYRRGEQARRCHHRRQALHRLCMAFHAEEACPVSARRPRRRNGDARLSTRSPRDTERVDHPHHAGLWFNYGNVNGFDFWNNSDAIKPENRVKMGTIHHEKIVSVKSGAKGELVVDSVWETGAGQKIFNQRTKYVFSQKGDARTIDMTVTLQRARQGRLSRRQGRRARNPRRSLSRVTHGEGRHLCRCERTGDEGGRQYCRSHRNLSHERRRRGRRRMVDPRTLVRADGPHPRRTHRDDCDLRSHGNPGYPTYWHARGYGLFAANPLGRKIFDAKQPQFDYTVEKGAFNNLSLPDHHLLARGDAG